MLRIENEFEGTLGRNAITEIDHKLLDPFELQLEFSFSLSAGFPDHPHRDKLCAGFESVTYILQGGIIHKFLKGDKRTIRAGDVQWMTAGRGIIHSESPE
ncbi:unnamed protein product [Microthlaspi erraticum]|uniref:Pirin N-terminal domain-containing protein n=1 Tax=Microthlaspi erraticum TaxID=1685480 RepID=A0A6D2HNR4_9BRAS|nr:unnamed protein product [Microthlaspi erraticum]CAA7021604.1 unnamed protein product [Microthlaspi erraticum]